MAEHAEGAVHLLPGTTFSSNPAVMRGWGRRVEDWQNATKTLDGPPQILGYHPNGVLLPLWFCGELAPFCSKEMPANDPWRGALLLFFLLGESMTAFIYHRRCRSGCNMLSGRGCRFVTTRPCGISCGNPIKNISNRSEELVASKQGGACS